MFYLTTRSTHFIYGYIASDMVKDHSDSERGNPMLPQTDASPGPRGPGGNRKEGHFLFNDVRNTFYLRLYSVRHMVMDHSDSEKGNLLLSRTDGSPGPRGPGGEREREMFYLTTCATHFIYGYMASDIWLRTILMVRKETSCRHMGYSLRLAARAHRVLEVTTFKITHRHLLLSCTRREMFYLTTCATHFIYGYMASDI